jgi:hypothetical protein
VAEDYGADGGLVLGTDGLDDVVVDLEAVGAAGCEASHRQCGSLTLDVVDNVLVERAERPLLASDLTNPDYGKLAGAFGIAYQKAHDPAELEAVLKEAVPASEPVLVEVPAGEFPSPWHLIHEGIPRP